MKRCIALGLAMLVGAAFGIAAVSELSAQTKAPGAYAILDITQVTDPDLLKQISAKATPMVDAAGGRYLARTNHITALSGSPPDRMVIIAFDSVEQAKAWYASPAQAEINAMGDRAYKARWFVVEGVPN